MLIYSILFRLAGFIIRSNVPGTMKQRDIYHGMEEFSTYFITNRFPNLFCPILSRMYVPPQYSTVLTPISFPLKHFWTHSMRSIRFTWLENYFPKWLRWLAWKWKYAFTQAPLDTTTPLDKHIQTTAKCKGLQKA